MSYGRVTHSTSPCISGGFGRTPKSASPSLTPEKNNDKKILEVTQKIIELLSGKEGRRAASGKRFMMKAVKQEDDTLQSEGGSPTTKRYPRPLNSRDEKGFNNMKKKNSHQNTYEERREAAPRMKKQKARTTERISKARKRGRPRKRRIPETAPGPQSPLGSEDVHVITEDYQGEAKEVMTSGDDQQNNDKEEVHEDLHTGRRRLQPKEAAPSITSEEEDCEEHPHKDSDWEISADGSLRSITPDGPDPSQEDTIIKVSLVDVQEEAEPSCHNGKQKTFTCLDCGRCFSSSQQLESHHKVHTGEAPFSCTACGSSFTTSEELGEHLGVHASEKLFACSLCGKCFTVKANLIAHRRVHTGAKPFTCAECGRRFALRSSLETHLPTHTIEKPYPCVMCGKCFTTSGRLAVHQTTHTGEKTYECEDCGKIFTTSSSMNRHRRTHTGEKPYSCMVCGKCFNRETNLYRHQMIHTR